MSFSRNSASVAPVVLKASVFLGSRRPCASKASWALDRDFVAARTVTPMFSSIVRVLMTLLMPPHVPMEALINKANLFLNAMRYSSFGFS